MNVGDQKNYRGDTVTVLRIYKSKAFVGGGVAKVTDDINVWFANFVGDVFIDLNKNRKNWNYK